MTKAHDVEIRLIPVRPRLADSVLATCGFCNRKAQIKPDEFQRNANLAHSRYHCTFCLRQRHHHRDARNILPLNFLGIVGYYYHVLYDSTPRTLWLSQIAEYIRKHEQIGLSNPAFSYDRESGMWFINFNRVGRGKNETPLQEILETVRKIVICFDLVAHVPQVNLEHLLQRYADAVKLYYSQRQKPDNILSPAMNSDKPVNLSFILDSSPHHDLPKIMEADTEVVNQLDEWSLNTLQVVVKKKKADGIAGFEGTVSIPGLKTSKIARRDGSTFFTTRNGLNSVAREFAKRLSCTVVFSEPSKEAKKAKNGTESHTNVPE